MNVHAFYLVIVFCSVLQTSPVSGQNLLPPVANWKGNSLELIAKKNTKWITPAEASDFKLTPSYEETMQWLGKLCAASEGTMQMVSIGKSANYRDINMVIVSSEGFEQNALKKSKKPLLLIQAGIHSGEIDGKDAGMMLLRDLAFGSRKSFLQQINILFIPILNVDGHERTSPYNRVNQRGPDNMGWRTNAKNLNLNRDYSKLDSEELRAVVQVMNEYDPDLYLDLHVTDGTDYQYDITYGFDGGYSPSIGAWLKTSLSPVVDKHLKKMGHIPGPLIFATNELDFRDGVTDFPYSARFSHSYGDVRHLPSILVENHSLKPFKQRVLGTYVFLEGVMTAMISDFENLEKAIAEDNAKREKEVVLTWQEAEQKDTVGLLTIKSNREKSQITNGEFIVWNGQPIVEQVLHRRFNHAEKKTSRPRAYWVPATHKDIIARLNAHGVLMEVLTIPEEIKVSMYRLSNYKFSATPFEGHFTVKAEVVKESRVEKFYPGSIRVDTNQPLGDLIILLLHPESPDSFLQWGFFPEIFSRTEYIESYAIEPLARKMLSEDPKLKEEFERKKKSDEAFAKNPQAIYEWFYSRSPYFDSRWLLYPVGEEH